VLDRDAGGEDLVFDVIDVGEASLGHVAVMALDATRRHLVSLLLVEPRKRLGGLQGGDEQDSHGSLREHGASGQRWPGMRTPGKRPPAPSVPRRPDINARIAAEIYIALEHLDAGPELLAIVGGWRDTLLDADVLPCCGSTTPSWRRCTGRSNAGAFDGLDTEPATLRAWGRSADSARAMSRKPRARQDARASNDNIQGAAPRLQWAWDVYYAAAKARWVGRVEANDADEAIQAAAVTFGADVRKLIAMRRREIASRILHQNRRLDLPQGAVGSSRLFVRRLNALTNPISNFWILSCRFQNRCVLLNREPLFGHGLYELIVGFRHNTFLCFRDALLVVFLEAHYAFHRGRDCTKLLIREVWCGGGRTRRR
jgi:hypothetical protein